MRIEVKEFAGRKLRCNGRECTLAIDVQEHLGVSKQRVSQLVTEGKLTRYEDALGPGVHLYPIADVVHQWLAAERWNISHGKRR